MSGHSKWSKIKRQKEVSDQKKGQLFSKLIRQITIAVREGGPDSINNFKLRIAIEKAREAEMPGENIERAIQKAQKTGEAGGVGSVTYEGFGPYATAFIIEAATDNKNRTTSAIRHILEEHGGTLGQPGSVAWNFEAKGQILVERGNVDLSEIELSAIDAGAEDVKTSEEGLEIYTTPLDLKSVKEALQKTRAGVASAEIIMVAKTGVDLVPAQKEKVQKLFDTLADNEDVVAVHTSANL